MKSASARVFLYPHEIMRPGAMRARERSVSGLALITRARLPANLSLTRLQSSQGRQNAFTATLIVCSARRLKKNSVPSQLLYKGIQ